MNRSILEKLQGITAEEQAILDGRTAIDRDIYMQGRSNTVNANKLLAAGKLITIRPHTRFIHFPEHTHDYVEVIYMCAGQTTHIVNGKRINLQQGEILFLNQSATHEVYKAEAGDVAVNLIVLTGFFQHNAGGWDLNAVKRVLPLGFDATALAGKIFIVTGSGKYFKNVIDDPENNLGIVRISKDGQNAELLWGYSDGGKCTSEFPAHLMSHMARLQVDPENRVVMHTHPTHTLAMNYVHELDDKKFSHTLWEMCTECIVIFPEGIGVLPWMLCGTNSIGEATAAKMRDFRIVIWGMHGIYGAGKTMDETFGLIETVEKAAQIYMLTAHLPRINTIKDEEMVELAEFFGVKYRKDFLNL